MKFIKRLFGPKELKGKLTARQKRRNARKRLQREGFLERFAIKTFTLEDLFKAASLYDKHISDLFWVPYDSSSEPEDEMMTVEEVREMEEMIRKLENDELEGVVIPSDPEEFKEFAKNLEEEMSIDGETSAEKEDEAFDIIFKNTYGERIESDIKTLSKEGLLIKAESCRLTSKAPMKFFCVAHREMIEFFVTKLTEGDEKLNDYLRLA